MSFRAAQDHNKVAGRDTTSSMASSTRQEDPAATTWHRSSCFDFACRSFSFGFPSHELHCLKVVELVSVSLVINYLVDLIMCLIISYLNNIPVYCAYFGGSLSGEVAKIGSSKKIKLLYSLVNR
jgi:hypothetical protein